VSATNSKAPAAGDALGKVAASGVRSKAAGSYGVVDLKTHAKLCLIVRDEQDGLRR